MQTSVFPEAFKNLFAPIFISFILIVFFQPSYHMSFSVTWSPGAWESLFLLLVLSRIPDQSCATQTSLFIMGPLQGTVSYRHLA